MEKRFKKPLHILVDGADKLGKTTVVQMLSRELNIPIIKMPRSAEFINDNSIEKMSKFFNEILIQFQEYDFIMDRGYTSSIIYNLVFNRGEEMGYTEIIEGILKPKVFILTGVQKGLDDLQEINKKWVKIDTEFLELADKMNYTIIDTSDKSPIELCNKILENL